MTTPSTPCSAPHNGAVPGNVPGGSTTRRVGPPEEALDESVYGEIMRDLFGGFQVGE